MYRTDLFKSIRYPVGQIFEDSAITYNILAVANKVEIISEPLYNYRISRKDAITKRANKDIFDIFKSCISIIRFYEEKKIFKKFYEEIEYLCIMHIFARIKTLKGCKNKILIFSFVNKAFKFLNRYFPLWRKNHYFVESRIKATIKDSRQVYNSVRDNKYMLILYLHAYPVFQLLKKIKRKIYDILDVSKKNKTRKSKINKVSLEPLEQEDLKKLQLYELEILKTIDCFCMENNLTYYLAEGTLLGAARHEGFIPWDDDVDIAMPREDYEKFIQVWGNANINSCILLHNTTYNKYYLPFAKIVLNEGTEFISSIRLVPEKFQGPCVDVFPLDEASSSIDMRFLFRCRKIRKLRNLLLIKANYKKEKSILKRILAKCYSYKKLHTMIKELCTYRNGNETNNFINYASSYDITRETFPKEYFTPITTVFEGIYLNIPAQYDKILRITYGDYLVLPPEEKRKCKHSFQKRIK